jgi:cytidylate kinase
MRLPEDLTVALFGRSAVGKSTLSNALARRFGVPVRHCGDLAKQRAKDLGCPISDLASTEHDDIDSATRQVAVTPRESWMVVEGRYLDLVLSEVPSVFLIELTCDGLKRAARRGTDAQSVSLEDQADTEFRARLSRTRSARGPELTLDTSDRTEHEVEEAIVRSLRELDHSV